MASTSSNIPIEAYHGVPEGWSKPEIVATYDALNGEFSIEVPEATESGAPSWLPDRYNWLQYRVTLHRVADGVRLGDPALIELAIRYIELNYFGSYSGFIKERLARALKSQSLSKSQNDRLKQHFRFLVANGQCFQEFKEYRKLLQHIERQET